MNLTPQEKLARERVCIALDTDSVDQALEWSRRLSPYAGSFKIGKTLHAIAGLEGRNIIGEIAQVGGSSFLDLKAKDTPDQIYSFSKTVSVPGVYMWNIHIHDKKMCEAAVRGAHEQSQKLGIERPLVIGVTELTSTETSDLETLGNILTYDESVLNKAELAIEYGLDGIVCPASKAGGLEKIFGDRLSYVTPGIKMGDIANVGQKQLYEPSDAVKDCSKSILIMGTAITSVPAMEQQAHRALKEIAPYVKAA